MYIVFLSYKVPVEKIDRELEDHRLFLNEQYVLGNIHASGRLDPRTGGIILSMMKNKAELEKILENDPFKKKDMADYDIIEFMPSRACKELEFLIQEK